MIHKKAAPPCNQTYAWFVEAFGHAFVSANNQIKYPMLHPMNNLLQRTLLGATLSLSLATLALAKDKDNDHDVFILKVVAKGLSRPTGIVAASHDRIFFTEIPTPGVAGGLNAVKELNLRSGAISTIHQGEPNPVNITIDHCDVLYWTCKTAGVILESGAYPGATAAKLLTGLTKPSGIAVDRDGKVYYTELPTPGVAGGLNKVSVVDTESSNPPVVLHMGEPEPTDIAVSKHGDLYWACKTAGVILHRDEEGVTTKLLTGLISPQGIALNRSSRLLYWTEVPTPGVSGANGGTNKVWQYDLKQGVKTLVHSGDPEPSDVTVGPDGSVYWTCSSAGVIVQARKDD